LESSSPTMRRRGLRITAAANTGPKSEPRPASSRPAMRCQPLCRAVRSNREEQSRRIGADSSIAFAVTTCALLQEGMPRCLIRSGFRDGFRGCFHRLFPATNARRFAFELAQVIELRAANAARLQNFDRADHGGINRENSFHTDSKTHPSYREGGAGKMSSPADHHTFKRLQALF